MTTEGEDAGIERGEVVDFRDEEQVRRLCDFVDGNITLEEAGPGFFIEGLTPGVYVDDETFQKISGKVKPDA